MQNTPHLNTKTLVMASLLAALCCVATMVIRIPSPTGGYMNLGDTVVILSAYLLGPAWGSAASGLGSALADLFSGYTAYVPGPHGRLRGLDIPAYEKARSSPTRRGGGGRGHNGRRLLAV